MSIVSPLSILFLLVFIVVVVFDAVTTTTTASAAGIACDVTNLPVVFYVNSPVLPSETAMLRGWNYAQNVTVEVSPIDSFDASPYLQPLDPRSVLDNGLYDIQGSQSSSMDPSVQSDLLTSFTWQTVPLTPGMVSDRTVAFTIPHTWNAGAYAVRVGNPVGPAGTCWSPVQIINSPDVWSLHGDQGLTASPGGWIRAFGKQLSILNGQIKWPTLVLLSTSTSNQYLLSPQTAHDGYSVTFSVPSYIPQDSYTVFYHNGYGGSAGWVKYSKVVDKVYSTFAVAAPVLSTWPQNVVSFLDFPSSLTADDKMTSCLSNLTSSEGGILYIPTGTWIFSATNWAIPHHVQIVGDGMDRTILQWVNTPFSGFLFSNVDNIYGFHNSTGLPTRNPYFYSRFSMANLTIITSADYIGSIFSLGNWDSQSSDASFFQGLHIQQTSKTCRFSTSPPMNAAGSIARSGAGYVLTSNNTFACDYTSTVFELIDVHNLIISDCVFDVRYFLRSGSGGHYAIPSSNIRIENNKINYIDIFVYSDGLENLVIMSNTINWAANIGPGTENPGSGQMGINNGGTLTKNVFISNNNFTWQQPRSALSLKYFFAFGVGSYWNDMPNQFYGGPVSSIFYDPATNLRTGMKLAASIYNPAQFGSFVNRYTGVLDPVYPAYGAVIQIFNGTGAGQMRYVVNISWPTDPSSLTIDRPWDIEPDHTSVIMIFTILGRMIHSRNNFATFDFVSFYCTMDVIFSENIFGVLINETQARIDINDPTLPASFFTSIGNGVTVKAGQYNHGNYPQWRFQFNHNSFDNGRAVFAYEWNFVNQLMYPAVQMNMNFSSPTGLQPLYNNAYAPFAYDVTVRGNFATPNTKYAHIDFGGGTVQTPGWVIENNQVHSFIPRNGNWFYFAQSAMRNNHQCSNTSAPYPLVTAADIARSRQIIGYPLKQFFDSDDLIINATAALCGSYCCQLPNFLPAQTFQSESSGGSSNVELVLIVSPASVVVFCAMAFVAFRVLSRVAKRRTSVSFEPKETKISLQIKAIPKAVAEVTVAGENYESDFIRALVPPVPPARVHGDGVRSSAIYIAGIEAPVSSRLERPLSSRSGPPLSSRSGPPLSSRSGPPLSSRNGPPLSSRNETQV